jgi:hypothetical protein
MATPTLGIPLFLRNEIITRLHIYIARRSVCHSGSTNAASPDAVVGGKENHYEH